MLLATNPFQADSYHLSSQSTIEVNGTSSIHDWTMTMNAVEGKAGFVLDEEGNLTVSNILIELVTENLKSKHTQMDKLAYKAMKSDDFPKITFKAASLTSTSKTGNVQVLSGNGKLTIAGVTKNISLKATCEVGANGAITCKGSKAIKMTDYNIDPPTAMFGSIKTGDEITVVFNAGFSQIGQ